MCADLVFAGYCMLRRVQYYPFRWTGRGDKVVEEASYHAFLNV